MWFNWLSLLRAIKKKNISQKISACDNSKSVLSFLKQQNLADLVTENKKDAIKDADLIIIATPLSSYSSILQEIKDLSKGNYCDRYRIS